MGCPPDPIAATDTITAWRIVAPEFAPMAFTGEGAREFGGRFNSPGRPVVYASASISLALLELLVQANDRRRLVRHVMLPVTFDASCVETASLAPGWDALPFTRVSQAIGDAWLDRESSLVLRVKSVVVPQESNFLINPRHHLFRSLVVGLPQAVPFDRRLG